MLSLEDACFCFSIKLCKWNIVHGIKKRQLFHFPFGNSLQCQTFGNSLNTQTVEMVVMQDAFISYRLTAVS